jgi:cyclin-dependent kinase 12/13
MDAACSSDRKRKYAVGGTRPITCMEIEKIVGRGTFGIVYKAVDSASRDVVALKKIKMERETQGFPITAIREIKILSSMARHPNIIYLREIVTCDTENEVETSEALTTPAERETQLDSFKIGDVFMVFEFVDYDLSGLLKSPGFSLSDDLIRSFLHQLLSGVSFLHDNKILHR